MLRSVFYRRVPAFSLVEISIVLVIIGVLTAAVLKGYELFDDSKATAVVTQIQKVVLATHQYRDQYGALPGDDPKADRFGVAAGNGDNVIQASEQATVWLHMQKAGFIDKAEQPTTRFGGVLSLYHGRIAGRDGLFVVLGQRIGDGQFDGALLTPKQAQLIKSRFDDANASPIEGRLLIQNGRDKAGCLDGNRLDLQNKSAVCVVYAMVE